ncbi:F0F1 ATP synthase subunit delta, partial [Escherichia coli]|nr:F0F1 ATP synthase subunit delta [Escherichia coli]
GVAQRYAGSLFDLALEAKSVADVEKNLGQFEALVNGSADLRRLIQSPVFSAEDQVKAISAILAKAKIGGLVANFLRVVATNRRLFAVPSM